MTVDWVVLTAAVVGLGTAVSASVSASVSGGLLELSDEVATARGETEAGVSGSSTDATVGFGGTWAEYLGAYGDDSETAKAAIEADAPDGYYFSGWIDGASGKPLYTANDGESFLVGDNSYGFNQYWSSVASGSYPI